MCGLWRIKISGNNRGSAVVEMSLVMPIILYVLFKIIFLFLDSVNDGVIHGEVNTTLYSYNELQGSEIMKDNLENEISGRLVGGMEMPDVKVSEQKNTIEIIVGDMIGKMECGVCTERLRRWQLYGDILWE